MTEIPAIPGPGAQEPRKIAADTAVEFEGVFAGQMARLMMEALRADGEFGGGHGEEMFRGILAEQLGSELTKRGGFGLVPAVTEQILRLQGQQ